MRKELVALDLEKRLRVPGLEPRRADLAVAGAVLLDTILRRLGAAEITLCDLSLREGLVLDYIARHRKQIAQADRYPDVRRRSVIELAERCNYWPEHAQQVARLALSLFDQTRAIHGLTDREREWLEYAALLHDIGVHISYERHHKHSYYLIKNGDLRGFEPDEIETIALVARYHRQGDAEAAPRRLRRSAPRATPRTVRTLAAILRLAESLDRSHSQTITGLELHDRGDDGLLQLRTSGDAELELWAAARHAAPFERLTGKPLRIEVSGHAYVEQPDETARVSGQAVRRRGDRRLRAKTTQLGLLAKWLSAEGHRVFVTEWNSSALVKAATKTGKKKNALTPMTFSLLHATDFADRLLYKIIPPLKAGMIVLADRYAYTAFARDATRGVDRQWVRELYSFAVRPDLTLYFRVPIDVSLDRLMARRVKLKFYEAGMDLGWSTNPVESFRLFQGKVLDEYDRLVDEFGLRSRRRGRQHHRAAAARPRADFTQHLERDATWRSPMTSPSEPAGTRKARRQRRHPARPLLRPGHSVSADRRLSRQADRDRGDRRRRPQHADSAAARVARGEGLRRRRNRLDAVAADAADDRAGQVEQHAEQADVRAALRDRLRRSARKGNHPGAQGRLRRAVGSLHLHGARARRRARRRSPVAAQPLRLRDRAAPGVLSEHRRQDAHRPRARGARHGLSGNRGWT